MQEQLRQVGHFVAKVLRLVVGQFSTLKNVVTHYLYMFGSTAS
ncbi:hypothetical protein [Shewanella xiamenensis]